MGTDTILSTTPIELVVQALQCHGCHIVYLDPGSQLRQRDRGGFGIVHQGILLDGTPVAIKLIEPISRISSSDEVDKTLKRAAKELYAWSKFDHPNISRLLGMTRISGKIGMVSRWMDNGTLDRYAQNRLPQDRLKLCIQLTNAVAHLHVDGSTHGDIKGSNVLVSDEGVAMLSDFGSSTLAKYSLRFSTTGTLSVSAPWTAPEVMKETTGYTTQADVYALGMTILEVLSGQTPFLKMRSAALIYAVTIDRRSPTREDYPVVKEKEFDSLWNLLVRCWAHDAYARPKANQVHAELLQIEKALEVT